MVRKEQVIEALKKVHDPEANIDVWGMGLIYDIKIEKKKVNILMTFTSPMCPYIPALMDDVRRHVSAIGGLVR